MLPPARPSAQRPFDPRRIRFYYGWIILAVGTLGMMCAVPGSPPGLSGFVDTMLGDLSIGRDQFSLAYTLGTISAGCIAPLAGVCVDRYGARPVAALSFLSLGAVLIFTAYLPELFNLITGGIHSPFIAFSLAFLAFAGIRVFGVAFGITACRSMIFRWFTSRRNIAAIVNGIILSLAYSSAPILINYGAIHFGTRETWIALGILFAFGMSSLALIFFRQSPESCGIPIESQPKQHFHDHDHEISIDQSFTGKQAMRTGAFWAINLTIAIHAIIGTGSSFHIVAIAAEAAVSRNAAIALFPPIGVINVITTVSLGWFSRRCSVQTLVAIMVAAQFLTLIGLFGLSGAAGKWIFVAGSGISWGTFGILISVPWARFYGRKHLGSINGLVTATTVIMSGLGPYLFGLSESASGSFTPALWICLSGIPACMIAIFFVKRPTPDTPSSK